MRKLLVLCLLVATPAVAADRYVEVAKPAWRTQMKLEPHVVLRSPIELPKSKRKLIRVVYKQAKHHFYQFTDYNESMCEPEPVVINIVNQSTLDNREYFPHDKDYSEGPGKMMLGRYYRSANTMYVVPPHLERYYWRRDFAHELVHYFYDSCGVRFKNNDAEHKRVYEFLRVKAKWFY